MTPFLVGAAVLVAASLVLAVPLRLVPRMRAIPLPVYCKRVLVAQLAVFPLGLLVIAPAALGYWVARLFFLGAVILVVAAMVLAIPLRFVPPLRRVPLRRYWKRALQAQLVVFPLGMFVVAPATLGFLVSRVMVNTRGDERGYAGPRFDADGDWLVQDRSSLRRERDAGNGGGEPGADAGADAGAGADADDHVVQLTAADGVPLRGFLVRPPGGAPPRCSVVLVHGLFRGAMELETVGSLCRDLGAEVLLLELSNHGRSGRRPATFGYDESRDVVGAVRWLRDRPEHGARAVVLFGVSLGSAAVALASTRIDDLGGLILDAPIEDLGAAAERMLDVGPPRRIRAFGVPQPFRWVVFRSIELFSGFRFADVRPGDALTQLDPSTPVLFIAGGRDRKSPPERVRELFGRLPTRADKKRLWIREDSDHGEVWIDDPETYRAELAKFLQLVVDGG